MTVTNFSYTYVKNYLGGGNITGPINSAGSVTGFYVGQRVLAADVVDQQNPGSPAGTVWHAAFGAIPGPSDIPHEGVSNVLRVDMAVRGITVPNWGSSLNSGSYCDVYPEWGAKYWSYVEQANR